MLELHGTGPTAQNLAHSTPPKYENMDRSPDTAAEPLKPSPAAPLPGVPDPPPAPAAVLPGFAVHDSWSAIQNSLYVILHHGPYQRRVLTCGVLSSFGVLLYAMSYSLLGREVDHWCSPPDYLAALSAAQWKNRSIPLQEDASFSKCTMYDPPFMEGKRNGSTVVSSDRWDYDIVDRRDSIVSRFNLVCDRQYLYGLSFVAAILANAVFSPLAGFVSDRFGRKPVIIVCSFTWLIAAIGNSVAETYAMFVTTRVLAYTACNSTFTLIFILLYEVTGNASRWLFTILDTAVAGTFGPPFVHVMSGLEPRWELSQGVLLVPTVLTVLWCCVLSESPAWLLVRWDLQRAQAGALEAALVNGVSLPKAKATFLAIANQMQKIALSQTSTTGSSLAQERTFKLNTTQRKAAAAFFTRFTLNAIYFGMVATEELSGMSWQLVDVFATTAYYGAICVAVNKYGPKNAALIALGVVFMLAASKTLAIVLGSQNVQSILQAGTRIAVSAAGSVVLFYTAEIFPTDGRSVGISMALFFGSSGTLCAIFVKTLSGEHAKLVLSLFAALMVSLSIAAIQWLPEVLIEKPPKRDPVTKSEQERKEALVASLGSPKRTPSLQLSTGPSPRQKEPTGRTPPYVPSVSETTSKTPRKSWKRRPFENSLFPPAITP